MTVAQIQSQQLQALAASRAAAPARPWMAAEHAGLGIALPAAAFGLSQIAANDERVEVSQ